MKFIVDGGKKKSSSGLFHEDMFIDPCIDMKDNLAPVEYLQWFLPTEHVRCIGIKRIMS